jgi:hypothetical protein
MSVSKSLLLAFVLALLGGRSHAQETAPAPDEALWALVERWLEPGDSGARREAAAAIAGRLDPDSRLATVQQLFLFSAAARDTRAAMAFGLLRAELAIPADDVLRALVALLDDPDPTLQSALAGALAAFEDPSVERGPTLAAYRPLLEEQRTRGEPYGLGLVRHLFAVDAHRAFLLLLALEPRTRETFEELRALLLLEHRVEDARWRLTFRFDTAATLDPASLDALRALAASPHLFARQYAARVLLAEPGLRAAVPVSAQLEDGDALVRELAAERKVLETPR